MTAQNKAPEPQGDDWKTWARRLMLFLGQTRSPLVQQTGGESAAEDGVLMWDRQNKYPVVSKNGAWVQVVLEDGRYLGAVTTDQTAASADTAYVLTYTSSIADGITNGTPASRLVFGEAGEYMISFSAQISAGSSSSVDFYFWPRINGSDVTGSTMVNTLKNNGARLVVSRSSIFEVSAGDYLEAMWATSDTNGFLDATAATAFCPAAPASTIAITRLHG
jgi:hypothetical protein